MHFSIFFGVLLYFKSARTKEASFEFATVTVTMEAMHNSHKANAGSHFDLNHNVFILICYKYCEQIY